MLLDTTYARRAPYSGTAIYLEAITRALRESGQVDVVPVANGARRPAAGGGLGSLRNLASDAAWTSVALPRRVRRERAQLIHHPLPAHTPVTGAAQVITVLDLAFERLPDHFDPRYRAFARRAHRAAATRADAVVCISQTTAQDIRELWKVPAERLVVAPLGPGQPLSAAAAPPAPTHFLYVGDAEPRKNLAVLLSAYEAYRRDARDPLGLVLAGAARATGAGITCELAPDRVRLARLYAGAAALLHPSLYEGFGLTALEAMTAGVPVVAARSPGVVEVCGDAARYADPHDPGAFAQAMGELAADPGLRDELARRGRRRAARFSWEECARRHIEAYSLALQR